MRRTNLQIKVVNRYGRTHQPLAANLLYTTRKNHLWLVRVQREDNQLSSQLFSSATGIKSSQTRITSLVLTTKIRKMDLFFLSVRLLVLIIFVEAGVYETHDAVVTTGI